MCDSFIIVEISVRCRELILEFRRERGDLSQMLIKHSCTIPRTGTIGVLRKKEVLGDRAKRKTEKNLSGAN